LITFDSPAKVGGLEARAINYSKELKIMGHEVTLLIFTPNISDNIPRIPGVRIILLKSKSKLIFESVSDTLRIIKRFEIDSIFFITGGITLFGSLLLALTSYSLKNAILIYGKDVLSARRKRLNWIIFLISLILSSRIGVNSRATSKLLPAWTRHKVKLLYPAVDPKFKDIQLKEGGESRKKIIFVGRLIKRKGCEDLIRAFKLLQNEIPEAELDIVGEGPESKNLRSLVNDLKIGHRVNFLGELVGENLFQKICESKVFCMPSKKLDDDVEGFGIVFLEAGLLGKPSVGTWSGGIPEAVLHNKTGILVNEGNILEIKEALRKLLENPSFSKKMGDNAQKRVLKSFTWRRATEELLKIYE